MTYDPDERDDRQLRPTDLRQLRKFLRQLTLRDALENTAHLPWRCDERMSLMCAVEAQLHDDARMLARVAPWLLTARLAVKRPGDTIATVL
jgi:hypothetical protein